MATGEDQPQPIVLDVLVRAGRVGPGDFLESAGDLWLQFIESTSTPERIDRLEAAGGNQPGPRVGRYPLRFPALDRGGERLVQRLLGEVEIVEQSNQRREHSSRLRLIDVSNNRSQALFG